MGAMGAVMRAKKPDWAQRAVEKWLKKWKRGEPWLPELAKALRAHHRRVVRMVRKLREVNGPNLRYDAVYKSACDDILAALKEMEK